MIDTILMALGFLAVILGILGCILPILPGPTLSYLSLLLLHFTSKYSFSTSFLITYGIITVVITLLDTVIPIYTTKRFNGSKYGIWGSIIGLIVGLFVFPPFGVIVGPFVGAFIGETLRGKNIEEALIPAIGSFVGFLTGTAVKLVFCAIITYHFIKRILL
ncbi:MAG: DUF456 domain-containing protein [Candidatus Magnetoovum sp. WYHC-5]|nr:DUF456 domain-containing protein [Candidatus Magnetoovum sp. WYHC-5]